MKILHTSDWHLGQSLNQFDRSFEHTQFLSWLLDTLEAEKVDALVIAGDVFDSSNPSAASQAQLYQFLTKARQRVPHLGIVMTAGNHDSPGRMEAPAPFLSLLDASVVGQLGRSVDGIDWDRIVIPLKNHEDQVSAWCIAMPFLRPSDVPRLDGVDDTYMGDEVRSVHSLSGGESFLVSLALALGLASLSSHRVRVESLFIDEGFGSLDADSLGIAMDALDNLQSQGRKVGVISHVQEMTERIGTRVQVQRQSGGLSRIVVC